MSGFREGVSQVSDELSVNHITWTFHVQCHLIEQSFKYHCSHFADVEVVLG